MTRYAESTTVDSYRSRAEIERTLTRYGASSFAYATQAAEARIMFELGSRQMLFVLPMPRRDSDEFRLTPSRKFARSDKQAEEAYDQAVRQKWRALSLVIKAKLEAVGSGITTIENEFLAHIMIPGTGQTVGELTLPRIAEAYSHGRLPELLPASPS